jgi:hypothetical protein
MKLIALRWLAAAVIASLVAAAGALAAGTKTVVAPSNNSPPTISGTAAVGNKLSANAGTWDGSAPIRFQFQWLICGADGSACRNISGETDKTYTVKSGDEGNTIRVKVIAGNADGSAPATSDPTAKVAASTTTTTTTTTTTGTTTTTPAPSNNGCPKSNASSFDINDIQGPARLQFGSFHSTPSTIGGSIRSFDLTVHVTSTCGPTPISGALVYATAVPYNQFNVPPEGTTNSRGDTTLHFVRGNAFPAAKKQQLLVIFMRARRESDPILAGISTRQLVSLTVNLNA